MMAALKGMQGADRVKAIQGIFVYDLLLGGLSQYRPNGEQAAELLGPLEAEDRLQTISSVALFLQYPITAAEMEKILGPLEGEQRADAVIAINMFRLVNLRLECERKKALGLPCE